MVFLIQWVYVVGMKFATFAPGLATLALGRVAPARRLINAGTVYRDASLVRTLSVAQDAPQSPRGRSAAAPLGRRENDSL